VCDEREVFMSQTTKTSSPKEKRGTEKKSPPLSNSYENYDSQMNEWSQKLEEFKSKVSKLSSDLQSEATARVNELEKKYNEASKRIQDLKGKGMIAKDEMKVGFEKAWKELLQAFDAAKKTFH
jgi:archaellum component FlaC